MRVLCFEGEFFYFKLKVEGESVFPVFVVKVKVFSQYFFVEVRESFVVELK